MKGYFITTYDHSLLVELLDELENCKDNRYAVDEIKQILEDAYFTELHINESDD